MSLKNGDLAGTVLPEVSIDEFEPKAGEEKDVIVVAFYLTDQEPADDLNTFIQRGYIDTLDVEISPNTDEEGRYLVFVEMSRDDTFPSKFISLMEDIENLTGDMDWAIRTYYSDGKTFAIDDPTLINYMVLDPESYVPKDDFKMEEIKEGILDFFRNSLMTNLTIDENVVILAHNRRKIMAEVIDVGDYDTVIGRNFLSESAFDVGRQSFESRILESIVGNYKVVPIEKFLCLYTNNGEKVMLLNNVQII
jgi:hypothetical protein